MLSQNSASLPYALSSIPEELLTISGTDAYIKIVGKDNSTQVIYFNSEGVEIGKSFTWVDSGNQSTGTWFVDTDWNFLGDFFVDTQQMNIERSYFDKDTDAYIEIGSEINLQTLSERSWSYEFENGLFTGGSETKGGTTYFYNENWDIIDKSISAVLLSE